jgi:hypothetical protein
VADNKVEITLEQARALLETRIRTMRQLHENDLFNLGRGTRKLDARKNIATLRALIAVHMILTGYDTFPNQPHDYRVDRYAKEVLRFEIKEV